MKRLISFIILGMSFLSGFTQKPIHQIGFTAGVMEDNKSSILSGMAFNGAAGIHLYGLQYRAIYKPMLLRGSVKYSQYQINNKSQDESSYQSTEKGYFNLFDFTAGIEKRFGSKKLRPYIGSELSFTTKNGSVDYMYSGCFGSGSGINKLNTKIYGISALAGLNYQINKTFACHVEFALRFAKYQLATQQLSSASTALIPVQNLGISYTFLP